MEVCFQRIGVVIFCQIVYLSAPAQISSTHVFFLDVSVDDILEVCSISFGRPNDSSLFYLNRLSLKAAGF
jgi:hypothetical protein